MRRVDVVTAIRRLRDSSDQPPVLVLTTFDHYARWGALDAGAAGFVLEDAPAEDVLAAARAVAGGAVWLHPRVAPRVLNALRANIRPRMAEAARIDQRARRAPPHGSGCQQRRDRRPDIGERGHGKTHVGAIFAKLGVRDHAAAIVFAYDHGIVELRPASDAT